MESFIPRLFKESKQSFFIFGARGTGKSTLLQHLYQDALWIDLLLPDLFRLYSARPERIIELIRGNPDKRVIVIDEIQKIPELLSAIHHLIEKNKQLRFILTGSSPRKLKRSNTDLLSGRIIKKTLHPFLAAELGTHFNLDKALKSGLLPVAVMAKAPLEVLASYIGLYMQEEIQQEGLTRNIGNFSRFLEAISFSHASVLNISNAARECAVERKVVENYIKILEDLLLAYRIPVFSKKAKRGLIDHAKFYFFDTGVFYSLRPKGLLDQPEMITGSALEGLIFQHLHTWNAYRSEPYRIYYWRTRKGVEVDFILYGNKGIYAFEVKNSNRIRPEDIRSLTAFSADYPGCKPVLLYRGKEKLMQKKIICLPCEYFLSRLHPQKDLHEIIG